MRVGEQHVGFCLALTTSDDRSSGACVTVGADRVDHNYTRLVMGLWRWTALDCKIEIESEFLEKRKEEPRDGS